jgi:NAD(P)-dependent dehydrogenase (short-subunit alcohol dehydrogenase family)
LLAKSPDAALVFALDEPARVGQAYWGGYGVAQHGLASLVGMLHAELANSTVRVAGLRPGPMRTPLRAKAFVEEHDRLAREPSAYAPACITLLSPAGAVHRGAIWSPSL